MIYILIIIVIAVLFNIDLGLRKKQKNDERIMKLLESILAETKELRKQGEAGQN